MTTTVLYSVARDSLTTKKEDNAMIFDFNDPCYLLRGSYNGSIEAGGDVLLRNTTIYGDVNAGCECHSPM